MTGCTFTGNSAANGAGLLMSGGEVTDCTFDANTATGSGGGVYVSGISPVMTQCTLRENTAGALPAFRRQWDECGRVRC